MPAGRRFTRRAEPPAGLVPRGVDMALSRVRARVTVHAPADAITARVPAAILVAPIDSSTCLVHAGADTAHQLALHILTLDSDFTVDGPPELLDALRDIHRRTGQSPR